MLVSLPRSKRGSRLFQGSKWEGENQASWDLPKPLGPRVHLMEDLWFLPSREVGSLILCSAAPDWRVKSLPQPLPSVGKERGKVDGKRSQPDSTCPSLLDVTHAHSFPDKPCGTVHVFYIFVNFKKKTCETSWCRVNTVFLHHLHLLPKQCRDV